MANKTFNTRVISKHDTETNWNKATNFIPLAGEIIIYDKDDTNPQRIKIGDGTTKVGSLPFAIDVAGEDLGLVKSGGDVTITDGIISVNDDSHNHVISNIDGLQTALNGKANLSHTHDVVSTSEDGFMSSADKAKLDGIEEGANNIIVDTVLANSENPVQNKVINEVISSINSSITSINSALSKKANSSHTHTISNITGLDTALAEKASVHSHPYALDTHPSVIASDETLGHVKIGDNINIDDEGIISVSVDSALNENSSNPIQNTVVKKALDNKANSSHTHTMSNITGLDTALTGKANSSHTHSISNITNLQTALDGKAAVHSHPYASNTHNHDTQYAPLSHTSVIASGETLGHVKIGSNINIDNKGTITVKDDSHNHIISNIDGLQAALDNKAPTHSHPYLSEDTLYAGSTTKGGSANSAEKLTIENTGSNTQPVYFVDGNPVAINYTIKTSVPAGAKFTDTTYSIATTTKDGLMSSTDKAKLNGIEAEANNYSLPVAGEELGGVKSGGDVTIDTSGNITVNKATALKSNAGAINQPIYFSGGKPVATTYALNATVPAGAKFTDTVYTHPTYTSKSSGFYKITVDNSGHISGTTDVKKEDITSLGIPELIGGKISQSQLPSYVDDVMEFDSREDFPETGETGKIYVTCDTNKTYRWSGTLYVEISASLALGETSLTAYRGDRGKDAYDHSQTAHAPSNAQKNSDITKAEIEAKLTGNISSHTHNYLSSSTKYAGSSTVGGSANSAEKLTIENTGSNTQPVYFVDGNPVAINYTIKTSVPAGAKFTDTVYTHPIYDAKTSGLYKITVDKSGHVSGTTAVAKEDITNLGIPSTNTTYSNATSSTSGLMSSTDKAKLDGIVAGANKTVVDSSLSSTSTNPVQNKVIYNELNKKAAVHSHPYASNTHNHDSQYAPLSHVDVIASDETLGHVKIGSNINIDDEGTITVKDDSHNHTISNIDSLQTALNGKANSSHTHNYAGSSSAGGSANSAVKLTTARTIGLSGGVDATATSFNGTANISIPVTSIKESYLSWGGKNFRDSYSPIDAAMIPDLSANRFAYANADGISVEYSQDGSTWVDYGASDADKLKLTTTGTVFKVGKPSSTTQPTANFKLRITFTTDTAGIYTNLNKFAIYCSTNYSSGCTCQIQTATKAAPTTFTNRTDKVSIAGWSGWNIINTSTFSTYGNNTSQNQKVRFLFEITGHTANKPGTGLQISKIYAYGGVGWTTPSNLAKTGTIYSTDYSQNTIFPAKVTATGFVKSGSSDSYVLLGGGGTKLVSDYYGFKTITNGSSSIVADSTNDTLTLIAGKGISDSYDATNDKITYNADAHTFTPSGTVSSTFAGTAATISTSYKPAGTISSVVTNVTSGTTSVNSVSGVGTLPSLTHSYNSDSRKLTLSFSTGSLPTYSSKTVVNSVTATKAAPTFTGTTATISTSYTPKGTITSTFTGKQGTTVVGS